MLVNRAYGTSFFWDGRTTSLEEQVLQPIQHPDEMDMTVEEVERGLMREPAYPTLFEEAFGRAISRDDLARALASYVRTILSGKAPIDRYLYGERDALSETAQHGLRLFRGKANCTACHVGPTFSDDGFHNTGVAWRDGKVLDPGRFAVTGHNADCGAFKTPTLREIGRTAPYMHDGSLATLDVIEFYDRCGNRNPHLDPDLHPLNLAPQEKGGTGSFSPVVKWRRARGALRVLGARVARKQNRHPRDLLPAPPLIGETRASAWTHAYGVTVDSIRPLQRSDGSWACRSSPSPLSW